MRSLLLTSREPLVTMAMATVGMVVPVVQDQVAEPRRGVSTTTCQI
jgi:hypothetical protein